MTLDQLKAIMPRLQRNPKTAALLFPFLQAAMDEVEVNTKLRLAAFLAQVAHESGEFKYMEELWGPTDAQKRYEPPSTLAKRLGNTSPGDGYRYRGRGPIQLTGRSNYRQAGKDLAVDLEGNPDLGSGWEVGTRIACWYWKTRKLNALADAKDFDAITKKINGGFNGKPERDAYYKLALKVLP